MPPWLRELLAPIPEQELAPLAPQKQRATVIAAAVLFAIAPSSLVPTLVQAARGLVDVRRAVVSVAANALFFGAVGLAARRPWGRRHADALLFTMAVAAIADAALAGVVRVDGHNDAVMFAAIVPLAISVLVRWRPSLALLLAVPSAATIEVARAAGVHVAQTTPNALSVCATFAVVAATASQVQRRALVELERAKRQLVASERLSSVGRMTAGLAHELQTPLAAAMNGVESCRALAAELRASVGHPAVGPDDLRAIGEELDAAVALVATAAGRASKLIQSARAQTLGVAASAAEPFEAAAVVQSALAVLLHARAPRGVAVDATALDPRVQGVGDPHKLAQIVTNLVANALDACEDGGGSRVEVTLERAPRAGAGAFVLAVEDDGPGVPAQHRRRIFDRLFTAKPGGRGLGLGLSIAKDLAESAFRGSLEVRGRRDGRRGARFELRGALSERPAADEPRAA